MTQRRVVLVTGASSGIGRAVALGFVATGARVVATARDGDALDSLAADVTASGGELTTVVADLIESGAPDAVVDAAHRAYGPVSVLVNCAGVPGWGEVPIWEQPDERWRTTMRLNLDVPFELTRRCAVDMRSNGWGRVVMISSTAGQVGAPRMSAYCASKAGLLGLTRSVAQDLGTFGATCNAVLPGWVRTPMAEDDARFEADQRGVSIDEVWAERDRTYPRGSVLVPDEIARVVVWLASDDAAGVNGEAVTVALGGVW